MKKPFNFSISQFIKFVDTSWEEAGLLFKGDLQVPDLRDPQYEKFLNYMAKKTQRVCKQKLQPWLHIVELAINWVASLHHLIEEEKTNRNDSQLNVPMVLTGSICSQAVAIRLLCLNGLDNSAKTILRSMVEAINICTATLNSSKLRNDYQRAQNFSEANLFWVANFSKGKLMNLKDSLLQKMQLDDETRNSFKAWQKEENELLNQAVHNSYIAAAMSSRAIAFDKQNTTLAILGAPNFNSIRTLSFAGRSLWEFSLFATSLLFTSQDGLPPLMKKEYSKEWEFINHSTFYVLNKLISKYWDATSNIDE